MHMIVYTSRYHGPKSAIETTLTNIVTTAKSHNAQHSITGVLFLDHDRFVQVLEGPKHELHPLLERIKRDPRHCDVNVLFDTPIPQREFADWNMDAFKIGGNGHLDEALLERFRQVYLSNFQLSSALLVEWMKKLIAEPDRFQKVFTGNAP